MKEDILSMLLQAENDYHTAVRNAVKEAEKYVEACRKEQAAYIEGLRLDFQAYEKEESIKLEQTLSSESAAMETEAARLMKKMKDRQTEKAGRISELLKEEVLSLLWR